MNPFHWTLLALCLAGCRAADSAALREQARGPGSRVVIPSLAEPRPSAPQTPQEGESAAPPESGARALAGDPQTNPPPTGAADPDPVAVSSAAVADEVPNLPPQAQADEVPPTDATASEPQAPPPVEDPLKAAAIAATEAGDYTLANQLLETLQARPSLDKARRLMAAGDFEAALQVLEEALLKAPERADLLEAAGSARLALADGGDRTRYAAAREAFQRAGPTPAALLGQSRAARQLGMWNEALECARKAMLLLSVRPLSERLQLDPAAEVVLADAGRDALRRLRATTGPDAAALQAELENALRARIRDQATDAKAHARLTTLHLETGKVFDAVKAAEAGLGFSPADTELAKLLARAALSAGGPNEVISAFGRLRKRFPRQALVYWYPAMERFKSALSDVKLDPQRSLSNQLEDSLAGFRECRALDPRYETSCLQYEVLCTAVRGWQLFADDRPGRLELARLKFLSMNSILPDGIAIDIAQIDLQVAERLQNGISGLARIAERYRDTKKDLPAAALVYSDLARVAPSDPQWARAAAKSAELAAEALEQEAKELQAAQSGRLPAPERLSALRKLSRVKDREVGSAKERERFATTAAARERSAREFYERSWKCYLAAVDLAPLDARLACDAARVDVYVTKLAPERAEALLRRAIQLAQDQATAPDLSADARAALEQAWGDALVHLGVIELEVKLDPLAASRHFEQSLAVGTPPLPRPYVRDVLLKRAIEASQKQRATSASASATEHEDPRKPN